MKLLKQIDFGQLTDPVETVKQREAFCSKVVAAKPLIEEIVKRMLRSVGQQYFGKLNSEVDQALINGYIMGIEAFMEQVSIYESEHLSKQQEKINESKGIISSGSNLSI